MSKIELTPEQRLATERRSSLLVSAAAGSGKTRVLTQRLMAYITDEEEPHGIDEFLVITYTRAASAELRGRILEEISRLSGESPQNKRLRRQHSLCYQAHIGTIHSFCASILRENCHRLGLSPDFSVGDEDKCLQLKEKALEKTLETAYESIDKDHGFAALVGSVGFGRDDSRLMRTVLDLHGKMQSNPYPERWAREHTESGGFSDISETPWGRELLEEAKRTARFWSDKLDCVWLEFCENEEENAPLIAAYGESLTLTMEGLGLFLRALTRGREGETALGCWDAARRELPIAFPRLKPLKNYDFEDRKIRFAAVRDACKKACAELNAIFDSSSEKLLRDLEKTSPAMGALLDLTLEFDRRYSLEKRRRGILDFSDLEHFAVRLLCDGETGLPNALAREISRRYREILVDEYQDVNAVQELILRSVSKDGSNIFMVGDVKQSIYRFRLADPGIFLKKLASWARAEGAQPDEPAAVLLKNNFRSDRRVLSACNAVFSALMSRGLGDIDYDADCALYPPDNAPPPRGTAKMTVIAVEEADEGRPDKAAVEAAFVARQIRSMFERGETVLDKGEKRLLRYSDIAILMRSPRSAGGIFKNTLSRLGIPVAAKQGGGFFESPEVVVMTALLTVIDNPHRDVPLTAVLSSPVFGFTADDLALIRAADRDADFFTALTVFSEQSEKCRDFLDTLEEFRALSGDLGVCELISYINVKLELPALWTAAGKKPEAAINLMLYGELAAQAEDGHWRGLSGFLSRLETMRERSQEPESPDSGVHNAVNIMSIHKSKGLEFPVVFLCDTARKFNKTDLAQPVLVHSELGLGGKITDLERGIEYPSLAHRAIKSRLDSELLSEEMRVLYVALTRAKERLFISCAVPDPDAFIEKLSGGISLPPDAELLRSCPSPAHWLVTAALADETGALELETAYPKPESGAPAPTAEAFEKPADIGSELESVSTMLDFHYPYEYAARLPSKITATSMPEAEADSEARPVLAFSERYFSLPDLSGGERKLTASEKGVATHTVMQFINFSQTGSLEGIESEIARVRALGQLSHRQAAAVDKHAILRFFASDTGRRILAADNVIREFRFSLLVPADVFYSDAGDEKLLLQGVVDCCIEENGVLTVIDYKTDYVTEATLEEKAAHYKPQLNAYALAMERVMGKRVSGAVLCFLRAGLVFEILY